MRRLITLFAALAVIPVFADGPEDGIRDFDRMEHLLAGTWRQRDITYHFGPGGVMTAVRGTDSEADSLRFRYHTLVDAGNLFVEFSDGVSERPVSLMLVDGVTDSTALLALGTPFVRADGDDGLLGTWRHVAGRTGVTWTIADSTVSYAASRFEPETGEWTLIEERTGYYDRRQPTPDRYDPQKPPVDGGRIDIVFSDGGKRTMLPVLHGGRMFLFDLVPSKSGFLRPEYVTPAIAPPAADALAEGAPADSTDSGAPGVREDLTASSMD